MKNRGRELLDLEAEAFELFVSEVITRKGYICTTTQFVGDGKKDCLAWNNDEVLMVEVKRKKRDGMVNSTEVKKYCRAMEDYINDRGDRDYNILFVTTTNFSSPAIHELKSRDAMYWKGEDLITQLDNLKSGYLVDIYSSGFRDLRDKSDIKRRLDKQSIEFDEQIVKYICDDVFHPAKVLEYVELKSRGVRPNYLPGAHHDSLSNRLRVDDKTWVLED